MEKRVKIISREEIFKKAIFRLEEAQLQHERFDGEMSEVITRISFERSDSVAAILHNTDDDTLILIEQFRFPTYGKGTGWLIELPAGVVEEGEAPELTMQRELIEETGYSAEKLHFIFSFFTSPGGSSERIFLYYARIAAENKQSAGGGLDTEGEDIKTEILKVDDVLAMMHDGKITDAKTLIGLQWLELNRNNLPK